ncbi:polyprenyl synthetase family protein [Aquibacillus sp. 3ASR75-11]|uniref:Farnesyl diphosphate synthase n=2 Tax=Terrihalobacillus insolitus TaxID=2950438 RepID=A0A9X4AMD7_9BACI|nr:farnesyl diphosphate synthase [Terrihalobacillus insolitus]MDC3414437.1 polyprenyl synthetase family protein [Terrihalobacillus insolitus]MDC3425317.1 polyprenyl synthetase family protein [Terrihalobacillus insolitus]
MIAIPDPLKKSMLYSIEAGGKRIRPILMMASCEAFGSTYEKVLSASVALEMVHTYSLIHDDLPAMDDDDYRRGKWTNHKMFDEATAILAGDALLTYSFEIISKDSQLTDSHKVFLMKELAEASGPRGMVAGQVLDMEAENKMITVEELEMIHHLKTGQLLKCAIRSGAFMADANQKQLKAMETFAYYLGLIFQVQDDILDVTGNPNKIGKAVGGDEQKLKSTYPRLLGLDGAIQQKQRYVQLAKSKLLEADVNSTILEELIEYFNQRDH